MSREQRRSPRIDISLPVRIIIHDPATDRILAESSGRIHDISRHGLRLEVTQSKIQQWHIFYNFHDNDQQLLLLEVMTRQVNQQVENFKLPVQPVWFDRLLSKPGKPFQLGMEFLQPPPRQVLDWLNGLLRDMQSRHKTSWWSRLFGGGH